MRLPAGYLRAERAFATAVATCLMRYATFSGRASRPEYWWFAVFLTLGGWACGVLDRTLFGLPILEGLFQLATVVPGFAVSWRRMHDIGRPGWHMLALSLAAGVLLMAGSFGVRVERAGGAGGLLLLLGLGALLTNLVWLASRGDPGRNRFGPPPGRPRPAPPAPGRRQRP